MNHSYNVIAPPEWVLNNLSKFEEGVKKNTFLYNEEGVSYG